MNQFNCLEFSQDGSVATITLNRPDAANAFNLELASELNSAAKRCREELSIRAVVLTGNGKLFCAGGDLASMAEAGDKIDLALKDLTDECHEAYATLLQMSAPVIVAVNGAAAGIGVSLTLIGDITIASEKASFTMAYTAAGLSPDGGATYLLPKAIGYKRAKEMMITNRKVSAEQALEWGLVSKVVPPESLLDEAHTQAKRLAQGATQAFGSVKSLVLSGFEGPLDSQLELEAQTIGQNALGADGQEGIRAFLEKRRPDFKG